ncbi:MAG: hypothetical protein M5U26_05335 [Planctomycetota bacterium]|nr:hypothetical protein [Planctomycetota bacterium]
MIMTMLACPGLGTALQADGWHEPPFENSPLDFWKKNRERLGFGSGKDEAPDPRAQPEIEDLDKAKRLHHELLQKAASEKDEQRKAEILEETQRLGAAIQSYGLTEGERRTPDLRRKAFIHHCVTALAYTNDDNLSYAEFPWVLENRKRFLDEMIEVFERIGPQAVAQLWEHLREELAHAADAKDGRDEAKTKAKELERRIAEIQTKQRAATSQALWDSLQVHIPPLQEELARLRKIAAGQAPDTPTTQGAPLPGTRPDKLLMFNKMTGKAEDPFGHTANLPYDRFGLIVSKDYVESLTRALVAIGVPGLRDWVQGCWDPSPTVREHARKTFARIGLNAVPALVETLKEQKDPARRLLLAKALGELTGQNFGEDAEKYLTWWEAHRAGPVNVPPPPLPQPEPDPAEPLQIGPRE